MVSVEPAELDGCLLSSHCHQLETPAATGLSLRPLAVRTGMTWFIGVEQQHLITGVKLKASGRMAGVWKDRIASSPLRACQLPISPGWAVHVLWWYCTRQRKGGERQINAFSEFSSISSSAVFRLAADDEKSRQRTEQQADFVAVLQLLQPVVAVLGRQQSSRAGALDRGRTNHLHHQRIA
jgi:hypothetical protein